MLATLAVGLALGWLIFGGSGNNTGDKHEHEMQEVAGETTWTCSMHPQIRQPEPGDCPICGMDLIPLEEEESSGINPNAIRMSPTAMQLANIETAVVGSMDPVKKLRLDGKVQEDERLVFSQSTHIPGRIEQLKVNFTGDYVEKGQAIASVYSPDMVTAQQELFEAQKIKDSQPQLFEAAKEKLKNWKLTDEQINGILSSGTARETFNIRSDVSGYVTQKMVNLGDYVSRGQSIYEIADLSKVWIQFDVYESDMPWIKKADKVSFTVQSLPGETFEGTIDYLDPVIDPKTRVAKARVVMPNPELRLKPEMFVTGTVEAKLPQRNNAVVIPKTSVMWTGERSVAYVKTSTDQGVYFQLRDVELGPALGESYIVEDGLEVGEEIAVHGTFSIDAAAQLAGKPSMMNPKGGKVSTGHNHGGMDMESEGDDFTVGDPITKVENIDPAFTAQLTGVYESYLKMKDAFVATDAEQVKNEALKVKQELEKVDMSLLKGEAHMDWMDQLDVLNNRLEIISGSADIEIQRDAFVKFNEAFYASVTVFGLKNVKTYYQYCPMADQDEGAYWFSSEEEIRNPYFGDMMMSCGEVDEIMDFENNK